MAGDGSAHDPVAGGEAAAPPVRLVVHEARERHARDRCDGAGSPGVAGVHRGCHYPHAHLARTRLRFGQVHHPVDPAGAGRFDRDGSHAAFLPAPVFGTESGSVPRNILLRGVLAADQFPGSDVAAS